jgi:hypothetical protein
MPRTTIGKKEIVVKFQHGTMPSEYKGKKQRTTDYTKCVVLVGDVGVRDENKEKLGEVTVRRHYTDVPNRVSARVTALNSILDKGNFSSDERQTILSTIRNTTN